MNHSNNYYCICARYKIEMHDNFDDEFLYIVSHGMVYTTYKSKHMRDQIMSELSYRDEGVQKMLEDIALSCVSHIHADAYIGDISAQGSARMCPHVYVEDIHICDVSPKHWRNASWVCYDYMEESDEEESDEEESESDESSGENDEGDESEGENIEGMTKIYNYVFESQFTLPFQGDD